MRASSLAADVERDNESLKEIKRLRSELAMKVIGKIFHYSSHSGKHRAKKLMMYVVTSSASEEVINLKSAKKVYRAIKRRVIVT